MRTIGELEKIIKKAQDSYYSGEAQMSDAEFDALWDELKRRAPESALLKKVGADSADGFPKVRHIMPMGSQEKAANEGEFRIWAGKHNFSSFIVQHKLDGASLELQFEGGVLVRAVTRGDGVTGDLITENARRMKGVVQRLPDFAGSGAGGTAGGLLGVRGEVLMFREVWREKYRDKANCRNAANGIMRRKDGWKAGSGCEDLTLICYDVSMPGNLSFFEKEADKIKWLEKCGFYVPPSEVFETADEVIEYRKRVSEKRAELPYDIDGLVVKNPVTDSEDLKKARPEKQIAFKFAPEEAVTVLREVVWSESGATYTPIGIVDPVRLAGTTVKRANLNNPQAIRSMGLEIGSRVVVVKRGEIIPKIERLAEGGGGASKTLPVVFPERCSGCGSVLVDAGTRLYCPNQGCPKRIMHRLEKWISVLDIRELGDKLLTRLFEKGRLRRVADLYTLTAEELVSYERMGELSAAKIIKNIRTKRVISLAVFTGGFDFEGIGETIMESVAAAGFDTLEKLRKASLEELASVFGLGEVTAQGIIDGLKETKDDMDAVLAAGVIGIEEPGNAGGLPLKGLSFCWTGEMKTVKRSEAEAMVKERGGLVKSSVVKGLSYLVTNDTESGSAKNKKAKELGVKIINEEEFLALAAPAGGLLPES